MLFDGTVKPDAFGTATFSSLGCAIETGEEFVTIKGAGVFEYRQNEAYIFCMSIDLGNFKWPHAGDAVKSWKVDGARKNIKKFSEQLRLVVQRHIRQPEITNLILELNDFTPAQLAENRLRVICRWEEVRYQNRESVLTGDLRFGNLPRQFLFSFSPFVKDPIARFIAEREFRFCYYPMVKVGHREFVSVKKLPDRIWPKNGSLRRFMRWKA